jgi:4-amino-4-deoxy-L-arabinose transferase-like glycosyltransferase
LAVLLLYPLHINLSYIDTDFVDYCVGIATFDDADRYFPPKRTKLAGIIPWVWSKPFGVFKGLALGASSSFVGICLVIFYWGRKYSPHTGWLALAIVLSMGPVIAASRMLNFYPELTLLLLLGAFLLSEAFEKQTPTAYILGGIGTSLCLLCDARGLIWGLFYLGLLVIFSLRSHHWKGKITNASAVILPVWLSWFVGWWNVHNYSSSLIRQVDIRPLQHAIDPSQYQGPPFQYPTEFIWGYGNPLDIVSNMVFLLKQHSLSLPQEITGTTSGYWWFWLVITILSIGYLVIRKDNNHIFSLGLILLPFGLAYWSIGSTVEPHIRFFTQSMAIFSIPLAIALHKITNNNRWIVAMSCIVIPIIGCCFSPSWSVEREISNKMLQQAFPQEAILKELPTQVGDVLHIQTLPVTGIERKIANDWDHVCTETLRSDGVWQLY